MRIHVYAALSSWADLGGNTALLAKSCKTGVNHFLSEPGFFPPHDESDAHPTNGVSVKQGFPREAWIHRKPDLDAQRKM